jgi:hypothetical protein
MKFFFFNIVQRIFGSIDLHPTVHGILSVEYDGRPAHVHDGFCTTLLLSMNSYESPIEPASYSWEDIDDNVGSVLQYLMQPNALPRLI